MTKTLLILSKVRAFPAAVEAAADASKYQVIVKDSLRAAESLLTRGAIDVVVLDVELNDVHAIRQIEEIRAAAPDAPLIVVTGEKQWEWEEDAYLLGVAHVVTKPIREKLLNNLLERVLENAPVSEKVTRHSGFEKPIPGGAAPNFQALEALAEVLRHPDQVA